MSPGKVRGRLDESAPFSFSEARTPRGKVLLSRGQLRRLALVDAQHEEAKHRA